MNRNTKHQSDYKKRMRSNGYVQITLWVKSGNKERVKNIIAQLNEKEAPKTD